LFPTRSFFINILSFASSHKDITFAEKANQYAAKNINENQIDAIKANILLRDNAIYIYPSLKSEIFNSYFEQSAGEKYFAYSVNPLNRLQFIHSKLGNHYYFGDRKLTAFYQLENDPMFLGQKFASLGRHLLFQALNPSNQPRVVMELTSTLAKQFGSELPRPSVENSPINFVGRGSGRMFSEPFTPSKIDGVAYVSIDIGRDGKQFPSARQGLMLLYGRSIPADQRRITTFGRDISLISEEQYQAIQPPASLQNFPADLGNKNLEYSGIYEDGWISERSFFCLAITPNTKKLIIRGLIPQLGSEKAFSTELTIYLDGKPIAIQQLGLGDFSVEVPVSGLSGRQRVDLEFSKYQRLPGADGRITAGKINFIGFE
jgi:hypothetical protein